MAAKAIIIGCKTYEFENIPDLLYPEADATAVYERLIDPDIGGYDKKDIRLLLSPIHVAVSIALEDLLTEASPADSIVVYFAGHGLRDEHGQVYLAVTDTNSSRLRSTGVSARGVRDLLNDCRSKQACVILDCCFSGAFDQGSRSVLTTREVTEGLGALNAEGTVILTSSQASQQSRETPTHGHGTFTHYLLQGLDGDADTDADGLITPLELFEFVSRRMGQEIGTSQKPTLIGKLEGGSFPLARSARRRRGAFEKLRAEIADLQGNTQHLKALEIIAAFSPTGTKEKSELAALEKSIREEMTAAAEEFRRTLYRHGQERLLSGDIVYKATNILDKNESFLFGPSSSDRAQSLLRSHFLGQIDARALQQYWPSDTESAHPSPPVVVREPFPAPTPASQEQRSLTTAAATGSGPEGTGAAKGPSRFARFRSSRIQVGVISVVFAIAAMALWISKTVAPFNPQSIRIGVVVKDNWTDPDVRATFSDIVRELNAQLQPQYAFSTEIRTFGSTSEAVRAVQAAEIDVAGEFAPYEIYQLRNSASPFISPKYDGSDTYNSIVFVSATFIKTAEKTLTQTEAWKKVLNELDHGFKLAVSQDPSTSAYWYPRSLVLKAFRDTGRRARSFEEVVHRIDTDKILDKVACGTEKVIAGVIAEFKFKEREIQTPGGQSTVMYGKCGSTDVELVPVRMSDPIKQGAFVARKALASDPIFVDLIKSVWVTGIELADRSHSGTLARLKGFEKRWSSVNYAYYANTVAVFEEPDPVVQRRVVTLVTGCVALLLVAVAYLWMVTRARVPAQPAKPR